MRQYNGIDQLPQPPMHWAVPEACFVDRDAHSVRAWAKKLRQGGAGAGHPTALEDLPVSIPDENLTAALVSIDPDEFVHTGHRCSYLPRHVASPPRRERPPHFMEGRSKAESRFHTVSLPIWSQQPPPLQDGGRSRRSSSAGQFNKFRDIPVLRPLP
jgi:hypothetical protein